DGGAPPYSLRLEQLAAENRDRLATELHAVARDANADDSTARRGLVADELALSQSRPPERAERAVRRARHRIFHDAGARREEAGDEVVAGAVGPAGDDPSAHRQGGERRVIRREAADSLLGVHLDEVIELISPDILRRGAERLGEAGRHRGRFLALGWEIEIDPLAGAVAGEKAALRVEPRLLGRREVSLCPEHVRARERGVAAKGHLGRRREPPELEAVVALLEERGLREVHLPGDALHP